MVDRSEAAGPIEVSGDDPEYEQTEGDVGVVRLHLGEALDGSDALAITRLALTRVVVLAGPANAGKTTILAELYGAFHRGPFGGFSFAGSRTLVGFEKRCHLSRRTSGREMPDTERTARSISPRFLHLSVCPPASLRCQDLLFADIHGEAFREASDSAEDCRRLDLLRRADHVAVLIDGEKVASLKERQQPFALADALLRTCLETGMLNRLSQIQVLITKCDLLSLGDDDSTRSFLDQKLAWLTARYADRVGSWQVFEIAARPAPESGLGPMHGLGEVLGLWVERPGQTYRGMSVSPVPQGFSSEIDRFIKAWPMPGQK